MKKLLFALVLLLLPATAFAQRRSHPVRLASGIAGMAAGGAFLGLAYGQYTVVMNGNAGLAACEGRYDPSLCSNWSAQSRDALAQQFAYTWIGIGGLVVGAAVTLLSLRWGVAPIASNTSIGATVFATF